jgi:nucleoside-diphosphate kinase
MAVERTLAIVKPDAAAHRLIGEIVGRIEASGLAILGMRFQHLTDREAREFYAVHRKQPFLEPLVRFMTSGPVVLMVLEGENAVARWRALTGDTDPKDAPATTIRRDHGTSIQANCVHGSDTVVNAALEVSYFFSETELHVTDPARVFPSGM